MPQRHRAEQTLLRGGCSTTTDSYRAQEHATLLMWTIMVARALSHGLNFPQPDDNFVTHGGRTWFGLNGFFLQGECMSSPDLAVAKFHWVSHHFHCSTLCQAFSTLCGEPWRTARMLTLSVYTLVSVVVSQCFTSVPPLNAWLIRQKIFTSENTISTTEPVAASLKKEWNV